MRRLFTIPLLLLLLTTFCKRDEEVIGDISTTTGYSLKTSQDSYLRYEVVEVILEGDSINSDGNEGIKARSCIFRDGEVIKSVGDYDTFKLKYDDKTSSLIGKWAMDWNAPTGRYWVISLIVNGDEEILLVDDFSIIGRDPSAKIDIPITAVTLETDTRYSNIKFQGSDGKIGDWHGLIDWAHYMGANSFWYLTGMTKSMYYPTPENPWREYNKEFSLKLGEYAHKRGLKFGAWIGAYLPYGTTQPSVGCSFTRNLVEGEFWYTLHFSLKDEKRLDDIVELVKWMEAQPEIDYIGLDYMRTGFGGYELVDDFVVDLGLDVPVDFWSRSLTGRMSWLTHQIWLKTPGFLEMWQWYKATRVARLVEEIKERAGVTKPLWVFTLSWVMGHQHGQDVLMINDAGADFIALMLYEANRGCFDQMMIDWPSYIRDGQTNIVIGNCVEERLLDNPYTSPWTSPEEWMNRTEKGIDMIYDNGVTEGVFWHDIDRALIGSGGDDYTVLEYALMGGVAFTNIKSKYNKLPLTLNINNYENGLVNFSVENISDKTHKNLEVELLSTVGVKPLTKSVMLNTLSEKKIWEGNIPFNFITNRSRIFIGLKLTWGDGEIDECAFDFIPVQLAR